MLTGRLNLDARGFWEFDNSSPMLPVFTPTIFDYLSDATFSADHTPVSWAYFEHGYCTLRFYEQHTFDNTHIFSADDPEFGFFTRARAGTLPSVSFIDPHYVELPPDATCDGPPADVADGQAFVRTVVEAVVASPAWDKTMLLIVYDEHGGFYDHVPPPPGAPASPDFPIKTLGLRVPAFVISPWVKPGAVFGYDGPKATTGGIKTVQTHAAHPGLPHASPVASGLHFDHTSILKTIARRFMSANPPYMGARYAAAQDLSQVIGSELRQSQFLPFIGYTIQSVTSQMVLDVKGGDLSPRTPVWQFGANGTTAQKFAFEDAGDGFVYIRSNVSNLYVTVDMGHEPVLADPTVVADPTPAPTPHGHSPAHLPGQVLVGPPVAVDAPPGSTTGPGLIQDVKYKPLGPLGPIEVGTPNPAFQRWRLTPASPVVFDRELFVISSEDFPGKVLQPADPAQAGSTVVLGDPGEDASGLHAGKHAWKVSTPLISDTPVVATT
jgi:hypothetical protein